MPHVGTQLPALDSDQMQATDRDEWGRKQCPQCKEWKWGDRDFSRVKAAEDGLHRMCKECCIWSVGLGSEKVTSYRREAVLDDQGGLCRICGRDITGPSQSHLDHDHSCCPGSAASSCGRCFRGLLCSNCNTGLGLFKDSVEVLESAIDYLKYNNLIEAKNQALWSYR